MLQREVPESVNMTVASAGKAAQCLVVLDAGGDEGPLPAELLANIDVHFWFNFWFRVKGLRLRV